VQAEVPVLQLVVAQVQAGTQTREAQTAAQAARAEQRVAGALEPEAIPAAPAVQQLLVMPTGRSGLEDRAAPNLR